ncbi:carbohydrate kinase family protein [Paenibacillus eucommiae]|uniref:Sugar/nucleoside kinase (Ribokinase family) n=1 Tax=Paenibacillus eucommiae TaxID=1355755 RepID=A0ABS4J773_9BACL|nr:sugar kinase [Paenibacillus eucommiae]MBP1995672.1 sugar/nucleoside kinase (ribokinase family) [Paenibacillus eucommiae]
MDKQVWVIGELNVDLIFSGKNVTPEPNREKLVDSFEQQLGSSSAITASGLAGLGVQTVLVSVVGDDDFGRFCVSRLQELGVETRYISIDASRQTGVTLSLSDGKDRALLTYMGTIGDVTLELIPEEMYQMADHIHFGSFYLQEQMRSRWIEVFRKAQAAGISTSFDAGWDPGENWDRENLKALLPYTDWFIPSEEEVERIFEIDSLDRLPEALPADRRGIAVKMGSKGSLLVDAAGVVRKGEPYQVVPVDTTGAGDSFNAGLIFAYLQGLDGEEMLATANACGALSTQSVGGTGVLTLSALEAFLASKS